MTTSNTLLGKPDSNNGRRHKGRTRLWLALLFGFLLALAAIGIVIRLTAHAGLAKRTREDATVTVSVVKPSLGPKTDDINLPGNLQAFVDAPLYARTDGYLKAWYFDIGARVKKGQLIAVIETPELDQQLEQARAAVGTAKANYDLAVVTNKRYQALVKTAAVSRQEADQSASSEAAQKANVDQAVANVKHYEALQSFEKMYAPFDGVVTERNTDVGQLVTSGIGGGGGSGTGSTGRELFRVAAIDRLRTFIPVPQNQSSYVSAGMKADIHLVERPAKQFPGVVARTSNQIDSASRTLLTEVDIDNRTGELLPGAYVDVHLDIPSDNIAGAVRVPANTMVFRAHGLQVAVVGSDNKVTLHDVQVGRDFGNSIELVSGVGKDDQVIVNPPDSLLTGQQVRIAKEPDQGATAAQDGHTGKKPDGKDTGSDGSGAPAAKKTQQQDVKPSRGSLEPEQKVSRKPDTQNKGGGSGASAGGGGGDTGGGAQTSKSGDMPASGATAPGTDGNGAK